MFVHLLQHQFSCVCMCMRPFSFASEQKRNASIKGLGVVIITLFELNPPARSLIMDQERGNLMINWPLVGTAEEAHLHVCVDRDFLFGSNKQINLLLACQGTDRSANVNVPYWGTPPFVGFIWRACFGSKCFVPFRKAKETFSSFSLVVSAPAMGKTKPIRYSYIVISTLSSMSLHVPYGP